MKDFNSLCKEFEQMNPLTYQEYILKKSAEIVPILSATAENGVAGTVIFFSFVLGAIAADGKLSEEEYNLMFPFLQVFLGDSIEYSVAKSKFKQLKKENKELKNVVNQMIDIIGLFSDDLKQDIIIICMMICAMDGKISLKEKKWIMQLMV